MRTTRLIPFLFALSAVAMTAAGCAEQPALFDMAYAPANPAASAAAAPAPATGIDNTFYGYAAPRPAPRQQVAAATASSGRGLFASGGPFTTGALSDSAPAASRGFFASADGPDPYGAAPAPDDRGVSVTGDILPAPRIAADPVTAVSYAPAPLNRPYTLGSGDRLRVVVFGQDGLSNSYLVDASGYIDMPLIGAVLARGATTDQ